MVITSVKAMRHAVILVVDDEPDVRITVRLILQTAGFECRDAATSEEAMDLLRAQPVDLVITDMNLKGSKCSGLELIDQILALNEAIPVILITGYPSVNSAVNAMKHGAIEFLVKPFDRDQLLHLVHKALQERQLRKENQMLLTEVNKTAVIEKLNRQLSSRINDLTRLYTISEGLNQFMDTKTLFDKIVYLASQVTGAQRVSVMLLSRDRRTLRMRSAVGIPQRLVDLISVPVGKGYAGKVAQSGKSVRVTQSVARTIQLDQTSTSIYKTNSWMVIPLVVGQELFGVINVTDKLDRTDFSREDEQILTTLAEKAGIKLENQALYEGIYSNLVDTLTSLVTTIEAKDPYTREHSQRVTDYAIALGAFLGVGEEQLEMLRFAGILHDIGKIGIRDNI
ncbi:MAG: response regulator, partial [bacterium]|nr:response regulator [bacterium]